MFFKMLAYYSQNMDNYWNGVLTHLTISLQAVLAAILIGVPLGILCAKNEKSARIISGSINVLRVIPSLALMVILIPLMGIGKTPAIIALTILAIPPVMINTSAGFLGIEPMVLETARGMGMSPGQSFLKVEVPLAFPLVLTGIRTSAVETIASASIAAYIGAGGLGNLVFTGIGVNRAEIVLLGGLSIAVISISADLILSFLQSRIGRIWDNN